VSGHASHVPGRCLLGAAPALAAGALAFNVYFLRIHHPGLISGKLSDLAINFLLPVALVAAMEWIAAIVSHVRGDPFVPASWRARLIACAVSAGYFSLLQLAPRFGDVHAALLAAVDVTGRSFDRNIADAPDLIALITTPLAALYLRWRV